MLAGRFMVGADKVGQHIGEQESLQVATEIEDESRCWERASQTVAGQIGEQELVSVGHEIETAGGPENQEVSR